jgi:LacI family transcriptional regulator
MKPLTEKPGLPRYLSLRDHLLAEIDAHFEAGDKFYTQRDLMSRFGLGYATVEKAMKLLVDDGLLVREQGRGTYVSRALQPQVNTVALFVPHVDNPFYAAIVKAAEASARARSYDVIIRSTQGDPTLEEAGFRDLLGSGKVAGFMLCPQDRHLESDIFAQIHARHIPCVLFPAVDLASAATLDYAVTDDELGAYLATRHLLRQGCRSIAFVSLEDQRDPRVANRLSGYLRALREEGLCLAPELWLRVGDLEKTGGAQAGDRLVELTGRYDGIFAMNDLLAIGILLRLRAAGVAVGETVRLIGFDDIDMAAWPEISLSTVHQPRTEIGQIAMDLLLDRIAGVLPAQSQVVLPPRLVIRQTA